MQITAYTNETEARRRLMLHTAFCPAVRAALEADDTIEVMANPDGSVWIERAGAGMAETPHRLEARDRERVIRLVASSVHAPATRQNPIVSAELPGGGERFEGLLPPVSPAPCFSIRKLAAAAFGLDDFIAQGALSPLIAEGLRAAIAARENILIAGGTSSGKTTFANALLREPAFLDDRIVILEDTRELRCPAPNLVQLRTEANTVSLQQLVRSTLRLRPDRIVIGEVRGAEALDLLKAWNTGHPGGITTLHANSAYDALKRLEQLTLEAAARAPFDLIASAIGVIVFMNRAGGHRRVEEALRVSGGRNGTYATAPLIPPPLSLASNGARP